MTSSKIELPDFLNNSYLEKILQEYYKDRTIKISKFESSLAASEAGNNYVGLVLRLKIFFNHSSNTFAKSFVIKTTLPDPKMKEIVKNYKLFDKEMLMFETILPKYQKILGDSEPAMCPESIKMDWDNMTLVFEDLNESGFVVANRKKGVDMAHARILMESLAKYHACSMVLAEKEGSEIFKDLHIHMINEESPQAKEHFQRCFNDMTQEVKTWHGYEKYAEKLENILPKFFEQEINLYKKCQSKIKVVIHGDLWVSNFMFKYDAKNNPIAVKFIDLQIAYYGSPIFDLIYFLVTSVEDDIRFNRANEVIQMYHQALVSTLERLGYKGYVPTLFELHQEYVEKSFFGEFLDQIKTFANIFLFLELFAASCILCLVLNEQTEGASFENMLQDTENSKKFRKQMFSNSNFKRILKGYLPIWDKKGLLDPLYN